MSDLISRQHAIYTIDKYISGFDAIDANFLDGLKTAKKLIKELPPVQAEPLTDKEQRIFLAAMGREEKVCKQVDDEYRECLQDFAEMYEDSLVRTCHEITRKVKGALWT